jgi:hypothetical protein
MIRLSRCVALESTAFKLMFRNRTQLLVVPDLTPLALCNKGTALAGPNQV